jgi:hypothetical protein
MADKTSYAPSRVPGAMDKSVSVGLYRAEVVSGQDCEAAFTCLFGRETPDEIFRSRSGLFDKSSSSPDGELAANFDAALLQLMFEERQHIAGDVVEVYGRTLGGLSRICVVTM